jgi:hypothetical protein
MVSVTTTLVKKLYRSEKMHRPATGRSCPYIHPKRTLQFAWREVFRLSIIDTYGKKKMNREKIENIH